MFAMIISYNITKIKLTKFLKLRKFYLEVLIYLSSLGILVGVSLPEIILRELNATALMVAVMLLTSNVLYSSFTVWYNLSVGI